MRKRAEPALGTRRARRGIGDHLEGLTEPVLRRHDVVRTPGAGMTLPDKGLVDGLECLEAIVAAGRAVSTREVAESLGLTSSRASRLIGTLSHLGFVEQPADDTYRPGSAVHRLAALSLRASPLLEVALPYAKRWWEDGFAVTVGGADKDDVRPLLHARPEWPFERAIAGHEMWPAAWSTAGVALL